MDAAVYKTLRGFGDHLQLSVFRCELTARQFVDMKVALSGAINVDEDQVLVVDLGAVDGRGGDAISSLGRVYRRAKRTANVF